MSANTRETYATAWRSFCSWADGQGVDVRSATASDVVGWLADLAADGKKPSTMRTYRAGVVHRYDDLGGPNPARDPQVRRVVSGLARRATDEGYSPNQADPLRLHHVTQIAEAAHQPRRNQPGGRLETPVQAAQRALVDIAMVAVAHNALLRSSELLALRWNDIELAEDGRCGLVRIRRSKTDQTGIGAFAPISQFASQALERIKPADADPDGFVFDFSASTSNQGSAEQVIWPCRIWRRTTRAHWRWCVPRLPHVRYGRADDQDGFPVLALQWGSGSISQRGSFTQ